MKFTLFGLCIFIYVSCGSMAQVLPHYNGVSIIRDESAPFIAKITSRLNTAFIAPEQREKEAVEILHQAQHNFRQCESTYGGNVRMIGGLKGCLGRFTGIAMSQISALESFNRNTVSNDSTLLMRNPNLRLQNMNSNSPHAKKYQSNESNENLNQRNSNSRFRNINSNDSDEEVNFRNSNSRSTNLNFKNSKNHDSNERFNSRRVLTKKHQTNESQENRKTKSSNESN